MPITDFPTAEMTARLDRIRGLMQRDGWDALYLEAPANVRYACGFRGEPRALWITPELAQLMTSFRSQPWAANQTRTVAVIAETNPPRRIAATTTDRPLRIGVDAAITHRRLDHLRQTWPHHQVTPASAIETLRQIKTKPEIDALRHSQKVNEAILSAILPQLRPGMTERAAQGLILAAMATNEAITGPAFTPIVAAGPNAWEIHHLPDDTVLRTGDAVIIDLGVMVAGYASDMTRTVSLGPATDRVREVHAKVRQAQLAAMAAIRPGAVAADVDRAARAVITDAGFGRGYTHGLGHGIGLEIHDADLRLSPNATDTVLQPGMALTIEPGIYLQDEFGVRTEDVIIVRESGIDNLTNFTHDLIEL